MDAARRLGGTAHASSARPGLSERTVGSGEAAALEGLGRVTVTRRRLLELTGIAALAQMPLLSEAVTGGSSGAGTAASVFRRSTFAPLVGSRFELRGTRGASVRARLVEVRDLRGAPAGSKAGEGAFALLFHGPRSPRLEQGMYELRHPGVAADRLLLVPSGTGRRGQDYEVVINQYRAERG
jgi:hypothetical protein